MSAEVTRAGALDMQVCVPGDWTDVQVVGFAEKDNPCGTTHGWCIRKEGEELLQNQPERNPCAQCEGYVHIMLDV